MNRPSYDEFEEVESPFAPKTSVKERPQRESLRNRKNVFNRPFSAASSAAPLILETTATKSTSKRNLSAHHDFDQFVDEERESDLSETEIDYLDEEEEEVVERRPAVRTASAPKKKAKKNLIPKLGWSIIGLLVLRLITMDRGVWDYFATEGEIKEKQNELKDIQLENKGLKTEISRLQLDKNYQRQLAKEHLGVIAADEFLILFAGETADETPNPKAL